LPFTACGGDTTEDPAANAGAGGNAGTGGSTAHGGSGALPAEWFACDDVSDCVVRSAECCVGCGIDSAGAAIAVNASALQALSTKLCAAQVEPCPIYDCALSASYVLPFCIEGRCTAIDIRTDLLTSCGTDEQCRLRWDTRCCEACGLDDALVALNSQVNYEATVCGNAGSCAPCTQPYPSTARAICGANNHCEVVWQR
jgi:hypothetical protein